MWEGRRGSLAHHYGFRTTEHGPLPARPFPAPPLLLAVDCESVTLVGRSGGSVRIVRYSGESIPILVGRATYRGTRLDAEIFGGRHTADLVRPHEFSGFCTEIRFCGVDV